MSLNVELESLKQRVAALESRIYSQDKVAKTPDQDRFGSLWNSALVSGVGWAVLAGALGGMPWALGGLAVGLTFGFYVERRRLNRSHV
ncbi:MAG: hypothetical protein HYW07_09125 [Candidatus Latescibacteria bacterium]|nr:hypothetical protein [Candidatus Latescibacterota bacterium]